MTTLLWKSTLITADLEERSLGVFAASISLPCPLWPASAGQRAKRRPRPGFQARARKRLSTTTTFSPGTRLLLALAHSTIRISAPYLTFTSLGPSYGLQQHDDGRTSLTFFSACSPFPAAPVLTIDRVDLVSAPTTGPHHRRLYSDASLCASSRFLSLMLTRLVGPALGRTPQADLGDVLPCTSSRPRRQRMMLGSWA